MTIGHPLKPSLIVIDSHLCDLFDLSELSDLSDLSDLPDLSDLSDLSDLWDLGGHSFEQTRFMA